MTWMLTTVQTPKVSADVSPTLEKTISQHPPLVMFEVRDEADGVRQDDEAARDSLISLI